MFSKEIVDEVLNFCGQLGNLVMYDWIPVPLVYTQVATICVVAYFILALMGQQFIHPASELLDTQSADFVFPIFTCFQFLFYVVCNYYIHYVPLCFEEKTTRMKKITYLICILIFKGWLKVGEVLLNPYGEDDDDFELNWLLDRHVSACNYYN